jgi:hypothetical protein
MYINLLSLTLLGIISRLIPHPPNLTAMTAITLFAAARIKSRWAIFVPIGSLFVSNLFLAIITRNISYIFYFSQIYVAFAYLVIFFLGLTLRKRKEWFPIAIIALWSSIIFFLITNLGVWLEPNSFYPKTISGLISCYIAGLPFLRNALLGDVLFSLLVFKLAEIKLAFLPKILKRIT